MHEEPVGGRRSRPGLSGKIELQKVLCVAYAPFRCAAVLFDLETECRKRQRAIVPRLHAASLSRQGQVPATYLGSTVGQPAMIRTSSTSPASTLEQADPRRVTVSPSIFQPLAGS